MKILNITRPTFSDHAAPLTGSVSPVRVSVCESGKGKTRDERELEGFAKERRIKTRINLFYGMAPTTREQSREYYLFILPKRDAYHVSDVMCWKNYIAGKLSLNYDERYYCHRILYSRGWIRPCVCIIFHDMYTNRYLQEFPLRFWKSSGKSIPFHGLLLIYSSHVGTRHSNLHSHGLGHLPFVPLIREYDITTIYTIWHIIRSLMSV